MELSFAIRPVESHSGTRETILAGPYHNLCMCRDRKAEGVEKEETWGGVFPHHPTRVLGERRKLPQKGPGRSPGQKWILCIFQFRKKPSGTPFSVFLSDGRAPKTSRDPGKLPPSLLSTDLFAMASSNMYKLT